MDVTKQDHISRFPPILQVLILEDNPHGAKPIVALV